MRTFISKLLLLIGAVAPLLVLGGNSSGGGGNQIVSGYVALANNLLGRYPWPLDKKALLQKALSESKIESLKILIDPATGKPVENQENLVAWSSEKHIQLKEESGVGRSWEALAAGKAPIAHQIAHELFRASGVLGADGRSVDDNYRITVGELHLDTFLLASDNEPGIAEIERVKTLLGAQEIDPKGYLLYCINSLTEMAFVQNQDTYTFVTRAKAYKGQMLSPLLKGISPEFSKKSKGNFIQLTAKGPVSTTAPGVPGLLQSCEFSASSATLIWCSVGGPDSMMLSDGTITQKLEDQSLSIITDHVMTERARTYFMDDLVPHLTFYGKAHPFSEGGFKSRERFEFRSCWARAAKL